MALQHPLSIFGGLLATSLSLPALATDTPASLDTRLTQMELRIKNLEAENALLNKSLNEPYISDSEPEISARLKAVESQANSYRSAARTLEGLQGIETSVGFTMAAQGVNGEPMSSPENGELNYRGDVTVSLPAGSIGAAEGFMFTHFRMGQGLGLENPGGAFSSFNGTSFQRPGTATSDSTVLLAQAWYQLNVPLPLGGNPDLSRQHLELNFGKMDPFMFFDQNTIADDETRGFMNQAFVHNPLLDAGGDIGVDDFGFTPGFRMAWINDRLKPEQYVISMGIFGAAKGASFENSLTDPFIIIQADSQQNLFTGLQGNYRVYYWRNGGAEDLNGNKQTHQGLGLSFDQKVDDYTSLFMRYGRLTQGQLQFDRSLTLGANFGGSYWSRGGDAIGIALGWLSLSEDYRQTAGLNTRSAEKVAEIFYRYRINSQFDVSPNVQHISQPGGNGDASDMTAYGLRAQLNF